MAKNRPYTDEETRNYEVEYPTFGDYPNARNIPLKSETVPLAKAQQEVAAHALKQANDVAHLIGKDPQVIAARLILETDPLTPDANGNVPKPKIGLACHAVRVKLGEIMKKMQGDRE